MARGAAIGWRFATGEYKFAKNCNGRGLLPRQRPRVLRYIIEVSSTGRHRPRRPFDAPGRAGRSRPPARYNRRFARSPV
jgi:hypothetical protein